MGITKLRDLLSRYAGSRGWLLAPLPFVLAVGIPLVLNSRDMWDGVFIAHAQVSGVTDGLAHWLKDAGWTPQFYLMAGLIRLADAIGVHVYALSKYSGIVFLLAAGFEVASLDSRLRARRPGSPLVLLVFLILPVWHYLFTSEALYRVATLWLCLYAVRKVQSRSAVAMTVGFLLLPLSFGQASLIFLAPSLSLAYGLAEGEAQGRFKGRTAVIAALGAAYYLLEPRWNPKVNLYVGNNAPALPLSLPEVVELGRNLVAYLTYLTPCLIALFLGAGLALTRSGGGVASLTERFDRRTIRSFVPRLVILLGGVLPHLLVGKSSGILQMDWMTRQAVAASVGLSLLVTEFVRLLGPVKRWTTGASRERLQPAVFVLLGCLALSPYWALSFLGSHLRLNRTRFEALLIDQIKALEPVAPGTLLIWAPGVPRPKFRGFEAKALVFEAWESMDWEVAISRYREMPAYSWDEYPDYPDSFVHYFLLERGEAPRCSSEIVLDVGGRRGLIHYLPGFLGGGIQHVEIREVTSCGERVEAGFR